MKFSTHPLCKRLTAQCLIAPLLSCPAWALEGQTSSAPEMGLLEELVVTASKRETSLQDTAVTVSVFSTESLDNAQIERVNDLQFSSPGLSITSFSGDTQVTMRGVGTNVFGLGADNSVATYIDGVYVSRQSSANQEFIDVARIEVLKGPQSTLYGRNATGGAINIVSSAPSDEFEASVDARYGNYGSTRYRASISGPLLGEILTGRLSTVKSENDGYSENLLPGGEDFDNIDNTGVRGALQYTPREDLTLTLRANYFEQKGSGSVGVRVEPNALPFLSGGTYHPDPRKAYHNIEDERPARQYGSNLKLAWELDWATLTSITAYNHNTTGAAFVDLDDAEIDLLYDNGSMSESDTWSQEFLLASNSSASAQGSVEWLAGAYYLTEDAEQTSSFYVFGPRPANFSELDIDTYALFGEFKYGLTDKLRATLGLRYSHENKDFSGQSGAILNGNDWSDISPKIGLDYIVSEDVMVYANLAKGFKSGGFNIQDPDNGFNPEEIWSLELGMKSTLMDGRMRLNANAFMYEYTDMQVRQSRLGLFGPELFIDNAGESEAFGAELELLARPMTEWELGINLAYLDAKFSNGTEIVDAGAIPPGGDPADYFTDVSDNPLPKSPKWSGSVSAKYTKEVPDLGSVSFNVGYYYQTKSYHDPFKSDALSSKGYENVNANVTFKSIDEHWRISVFGRNLTDELIVSNVTSNRFGMIENYAPPRTYGVEIGYKY